MIDGTDAVDAVVAFEDECIFQTVLVLCAGAGANIVLTLFSSSQNDLDS